MNTFSKDQQKMQERPSSPVNVPWWIYVVIAFGMFLSYGPALSAKHGLDDDFIRDTWATVGKVHEQIPERVSFSEALLGEMRRGHLNCFGMLLSYCQAPGIAFYPALFRAFHLLVGLATAVLLVQFGAQMTQSSLGGLIFCVGMMFCMAAGDVWPQLVRAETFGMLGFSALFLLAINRPAENRTKSALTYAIFLATILYKENFFLATPAIAFLVYQGGSIAPTKSVASPERRMAFILMAVAFIVGLVIFLTVLFAPRDSHGGQSLSLSYSILRERLFSRGGIAPELIFNSMFFVPVVAWMSIDCRAKFRNTMTRRVFVFAALITIPQVIAYATRDSLSGRYLFPMLVGPAILNAYALTELYRSITSATRKYVFCIALCFTSLICLRHVQILVCESVNLSQRTNAIQRALKSAVQTAGENGTILIVSPRKSDHAYAALIGLGKYGGGNTKVHLWQPNGRDWDASAFFVSEIFVAAGDAKIFNCIIVLPGVSRDNLKELTEVHSDPFTDKLSVTYRSYFFSLRKFALQAFEHEIPIFSRAKDE